MKRLTLVLLFAIGLVGIGCDEQQPQVITGPAISNQRMLEFRGMVKNAGVSELSDGMEVSGRVYYFIAPLTLEKGASLFYDIGLETEAELTQSQDAEKPGSSYRAAGNSVDRISIDASSRTAALTKAYRIEGTAAEAYLHISFNVNNLDLSFDRAWISNSAE